MIIAIRRISIALTVVGASLVFFRHDKFLPTLPVPPAGRQVKSIVSIATAGDYYVRVTMPKIDDSLALSEETVPCSFVVSVADHSGSTQTKEITFLTRYSEFGFGRTQNYRGGDAFYLERGEYEIEVDCRVTCAAAAARGATISLEQDVGNPTNNYIRGLLRSWLAAGALCLGLIGIVGSEFIKPNQHK